MHCFAETQSTRSTLRTRSSSHPRTHPHNDSCSRISAFVFCSMLSKILKASASLRVASASCASDALRADAPLASQSVSRTALHQQASETSLIRHMHTPSDETLSGSSFGVGISTLGSTVNLSSIDAESVRWLGRNEVNATAWCEINIVHQWQDGPRTSFTVTMLLDIVELDRDGVVCDHKPCGDNECF